MERILAAILDGLRPEIERLVDQRVDERLRGVEPPGPDPWMTTAEAADYLRLTPEALRARARRGTVPARRDGDRYLFHREELDASIRCRRPSRLPSRASLSKWPRAEATAGAVAPKG